MLKIYKCPKCGNVFTKLIDKCDGISCCGSNDVIELKANSVDAAREKHVPVVTIEGNTVKAVVGSVIHPMTEEHYIAFIALETSKGVKINTLKASDEPKTVFTLMDGEKPLAVYEHCNLHGLWVKEL